MAFGSININTNRRGYFLKCFLYEADNKQEIKDKKVEPKNIFYAKYVASVRNDLNQINSFWQNEQEVLTIETQDRIKIKPNNFVLVNDVLYLVLNTTRQAFERNTQFMKEPYYITTINIQGV